MISVAVELSGISGDSIVEIGGLPGGTVVKLTVAEAKELANTLGLFSFLREEWQEHCLRAAREAVLAQVDAALAPLRVIKVGF